MRSFVQKVSLRGTPEILHAGIRIEHDSTRQRALLGDVADNEPVAGEHENRCVETELRDPGFAHMQLFSAWEINARRRIPAAVMHTHGRAMFKGPRCYW